MAMTNVILCTLRQIVERRQFFVLDIQGYSGIICLITA